MGKKIYVSVVRDEQETLEMANEISSKIVAVIADSAKDFLGEDDPAEHIYLAIQTMACSVGKICVILDNYGKTYGIDRLTNEVIFEQIMKLAKIFKEPRE